VSAVLGATICWAWASRHLGVLPLPVLLPVGFGLIGASVHWVGWWGARRSGHTGEGLVIVMTGLAAGLATWLAASAVPRLLERPLGPPIYVCVAGPFLSTVILVFSDIYVGYTSGRQVDASREWSARFGAWCAKLQVRVLPPSSATSTPSEVCSYDLDKSERRPNPNRSAPP
jgi:hypothetical protein